MSLNYFVLLVILFSGLVTWLPRITPFILTKYKELPPIVVRFLNFIPIAIIFSLIVSTIIEPSKTSLYHIKWLEFLALVPTTLVAIRTKNILLTVVIGIISMAVLRLFF